MAAMACAACTLVRPASTRGSGGRAPLAGAPRTAAAAARPAPAAGPRGRPFGSSRWNSGSAGAPASFLSGTSALRSAAPAAPRTGAAAGRRACVAAAAVGPNGNGNGNGSAGLNGHGSASSSPAAVEHFDFIVLGSGIAGLSYALKVAQYGRVAVITKAAADEGCTAYAQVRLNVAEGGVRVSGPAGQGGGSWEAGGHAFSASPGAAAAFCAAPLKPCCLFASTMQGGICAVLDPLDSVEAHVHDTMVAGAWLNDRK